MDKKQNHSGTRRVKYPFAGVDIPETDCRDAQLRPQNLDSVRDPLVKAEFMDGVRQKWSAVFLMCMFTLLTIQIKFDINVAPYLEFLTFFAPVAILGYTASSFNKERAAMYEYRFRRED